ncbi:hypothetical protein K435DRAFT_52047, partial [Dendrothele bispora CBS 962.96]
MSLPESTSDHLLCANCHASLVPDPPVSPTDWASFRSRIDILLKSNESPTSGELKSMKTCLASAESKVKSIERQLVLLERQRAMLEKERRDLQRYRIDQEVVLNPVRRLPPEILEQIFIACVEDRIKSGWDDPLSTKGARWTIGYTCRSWRTVSLDTPRLWSNIQIILDERRAMFSPQTLLLGLHLDRSKSQPLTVGLFSSSYTTRITQNHSLLAVLAPSVKRWRHLHLAMNPAYIQLCLSHIKPFLTSLSSLTTSFTRDWDSRGDIPCDVFQDALALHEVTLRYHVSLIKLRWSNIHSLKLFFDSSPLRDILSTLRQMPSLRTLRIMYGSETAGGVDSGTGHLPVRLPSLRTLCLEPLGVPDDSQSLSIRHFLSNLIVPQLETFIDSENSVDLRNALSLFSMSKCTGALSHFSSSATMTEEQFMLFIQDYPHIRTLELRGITYLTNTAIDLLTCHPSLDSDCQLPLLENLVLVGVMSFDATIFVSMVESRIRRSLSERSVARIKMVSLQWSNDW